MTNVEPRGHVKVVTHSIFEFLILENPEIPGGFRSQTFIWLLVAEISRHLTLEYTLSSRTPDFARRGPLTPMLEESASHHVRHTSITFVMQSNREHLCVEEMHI